MTIIKRGGRRVKGGTFFNLKSWEFITVPRPGGYLPGTGGQAYLQVPVALVLFLGPLMGLLFVILLPLVGIVAIPVAIGRVIHLLTRRLRRTVPPQAAPTAAHPGREE